MKKVRWQQVDYDERALVIGMHTAAWVMQRPVDLMETEYEYRVRVNHCMTWFDGPSCRSWKEGCAVAESMLLGLVTDMITEFNRQIEGTGFKAELR